jgi:hypothetical protein
VVRGGVVRRERAESGEPDGDDEGSATRPWARDERGEETGEHAGQRVDGRLGDPHRLIAGAEEEVRGGQEGGVTRHANVHGHELLVDLEPVHPVRSEVLRQRLVERSIARLEGESLDQPEAKDEPEPEGCPHRERETSR